MPNKGYKQTKEHIKNSSLAHKEKHYSPKTEFKKGQFKGKTFEELWGKEKAKRMKLNLSLINKGKKKSKEQKEKQSKYLKEYYKIHEHPLKGRKFSKETYPNYGMNNKNHSKESKFKMSLKQKKLYKEGRKYSGAVLKCINGETKLENHPNWKGGKSFEPYNKYFNKEFKRAIRKRDNQVCMLCGIHREKIKRAFDIHHINYDKLLSILQNCVSLCFPCHSKTNYNRKYWTTFFQNLLSERYGYSYSDNKIVLDLSNRFLNK